MEKRLKRVIKRSKAKGLGLLEHLFITFRGKRDAKKGIINDSQTPLFVTKEFNKLDETFASLWAESQLESESDFIKLRELNEDIKRTEIQLIESEKLLEEVSDRLNQNGQKRREGEDKLSEEQVTSRRMKESAKELTPLRTRIDTMKAQLETKKSELEKLTETLREKANTIKMVCLKLREHSSVRITTYLEAANKQSNIDDYWYSTDVGEKLFINLHNELVTDEKEC